ncbi:MAG: GGDEF domain-containing protein [Dehalogenimonas sp.]|uniref:GGDEF domain-containing protein n=1 Tax=Candidatus Dehalogenimonas loeffleri TaxID=3127115 RepID=A0ABZ2J4C7_9CHLR|nr:GGDEF domain-containing protein [Dehalogenimonas sp.]
MIQAELVETLLDNLSEGVYFVDCERRISYWNKAAEALTGRTAAEVLGFRCADNILVHTDDKGTSLCLNGCPLTATMADGRPHESSAFMLHRDGHRVPVNIKVMPMRDESGVIIGAIETFTDNSQNFQLQEQVAELEKLSLIDELTRAGNRRYANITLETKFNEFNRYDWPFGVIMFDIDNFKSVNDVYGHDTGDDVLKMIARTIMANIRSPQSLFFRWGGEEFVIVGTNVDGIQLYEIAERMRNLVAGSMLTRQDREICVTVSAGVTVARPGDDPDTIMRRADDLMYASKKAGKNRCTGD